MQTNNAKGRTSDSSDNENTAQSLHRRGRPLKKLRTEDEAIQSPSVSQKNYQSYVMKLFDRSIDLAQFEENSNLYPICRSWIENLPRSTKPRPTSPATVVRKDLPNLLEDYKNGIIKEITELPKPKETSEDLRRWPAKLEFQKNHDMEKIDQQFANNNTPLDRKTLMADNMNRWKQVKTQWRNHSKVYDEKFEPGFQVLEAIYKK